MPSNSIWSHVRSQNGLIDDWPHRQISYTSAFGGVKGRTQVPQLVERWLAGEIDVESLLSHRLTLDEVNRGFELMEAQDGIRSVITF